MRQSVHVLPAGNDQADHSACKPGEQTNQTPRPSAKGRKRHVSSARFATLAAALLLTSIPASVRCATAPDKHAISIDIDNLVLEWPRHWDETVAVKGRIRCDSEDYCEFVLSPYVRRHILVEIVMLPVESQHHLVFDCHETPCQIIVVGTVGMENLLADTIHNIDE
nr:hypothetical protein [uncultured Rhodopila sp.]